MKDKHIIEILDSAPITTLSERELNEIRAHAMECASCRSAYEAARISTVALKSRATVVVEPSPFFQTRVLAALREQQAVESVPAVLRLWRSAKVLVSTMAVTTAALAAVSFMQPSQATPASDQASVYSAYSVIMDQSADDQMTYEQVLNTIYEDDDDAR